MSNPKRIFRQAALDRLASPDQLDQLMQVTTPKSRLALSACCGLLLLALLWSVFGKIPSKVAGPGILVNEGGVFVATASSDGYVLQVEVEQDAHVDEHQLLARLQLPEAEIRIQQGTIDVARLSNELARLEQFQTEEEAEQRRARLQQETTYNKMVENLNYQVDALSNRVQNLDQLLKKGSAAVSEVQKLETETSLFLAQHELARTRIQLRQIDLDELQNAERRWQQRSLKEAELMASRQALDLQTQLYEVNSEIRSPFEGTVLEVMIKPGQLISTKTPAMTLQRTGERLEARLFLAPADGKQVQTGMVVALAPVSVKRELFGLMLGEVTEVSAFPARPDAMLRILENTTLVSEFSQRGAPIGVVVELRPSETDSGYAWTSGKGPTNKITSGTSCEGTITVTYHRPISFVLPMFRDFGW